MLLDDTKGTPPDKDIICKTCKHKWEVLYIDGMEPMEQYTKAFCYKYVDPDCKPSEILFKHAGCEYYEAE